LALGVERVEVRLVLEEVRVELAVSDLDVRLDVIGEHLDVELHAFFGQRRLHELEQFGMWHRRRGNGQLLGMGGGTSKNGRQRKCGNGGKFLEHVYLQSGLLTVQTGDQAVAEYLQHLHHDDKD